MQSMKVNHSVNLPVSRINSIDVAYFDVKIMSYLVLRSSSKAVLLSKCDRLEVLIQFLSNFKMLETKNDENFEICGSKLQVPNFIHNLVSQLGFCLFWKRSCLLVHRFINEGARSVLRQFSNLYEACINKRFVKCFFSIFFSTV